MRLRVFQWKNWYVSGLGGLAWIGYIGFEHGNDGEQRASYEVTARTVKLLGKREGNGGAPIGEPPPEGYEDDEAVPL